MRPDDQCLWNTRGASHSALLLPVNPCYPLINQFLVELALVVFGIVRKANLLEEDSKPTRRKIKLTPSTNDARIDLSGNWTSCFEESFIEDSEYMENVSITFNNGDIRGKIVNFRSPGNEDSGKSYSFSASLKNNDLIGTYEIDDPTRQDSGCFYLVKSGDGTIFTGFTILYEHTENDLTISPYTWKRN